MYCLYQIALYACTFTCKGAPPRTTSRVHEEGFLGSLGKWLGSLFTCRVHLVLSLGMGTTGYYLYLQALYPCTLNVHQCDSEVLLRHVYNYM